MPDHAATNEQSRQHALDSARLTDTLPEPAYDAIVEVASQICGVPIALVSLIDRDRQWFKARVGLEAQETPRELAFCDHAIREPGALMEVPDARLDPRFAGNALVTGEPDIRFYAGMPLVTSAGEALGTVCVIDREPRHLDAGQRAALASLAKLTTALIEARQRELVATRALASRVALAAPAKANAQYTVAIVQIADLAGRVANRSLIAVDALTKVKRTIEECIDRSDVASDHGSEEILVVISDAVTAAAKLDRIKRAVAQLDESQRITLTIGTATSQSTNEAMEEVFFRADEALMHARSGAGAATTDVR